jgi:phosphatidylglycerophosphate synthase
MTWTELRKKCQRESDYIITLLFTNEVSLITTWLLLRSSVTPNQVTIGSILCALLCGIFYAFGMFLWGSFFLFISHMLDCTDGNLARAREVFSPFGRWLDFIGNRTGEVFIFLGVAFYFYRTENPDLWIILTLMGSIFLLLYYYIVDIALSLKISNPKQKITSISLKGVHIKWGIMEPVLYGFVVFSSIGLIKIQILFILFLTIGGLIYQAYKNYFHFKSTL